MLGRTITPMGVRFGVRKMAVLKRRLPEDPPTEHSLEGGDQGERPWGHLGQGGQPQRC